MPARPTLRPALRALLLLCLAPLTACGRSANRAPGEVQVFAAASLREALEEIGAGFTRASGGTRVVFNFAGSNDLAQQIRATRGADVFVSASERWMAAVDSAGRVLPRSRRELLGNRLVVVARRDARWTVAQPCDLGQLGFAHLALADPRAVPAGTYARTWLSGTRCGDSTLWQRLEQRVAPAPDVRAALGLVLADPSVIGIVYRTDQMAFARQARVLYEVEPGPAIRYPAALLAEGRNPRGAAAFLAYLSTPAAQRVFARRGFITLPAR